MPDKNIDNDSKYNKSQAYSDKLFNGIKNAEENGTVNDAPRDNKDIDKKEEEGVSNKHINNVKGLKQNLSKSGDFGSFFSGKIKLNKKKWPIIAAIILTLGGGIGFISLISPGFLLFNVMENLTDALDSSRSALHIRSNKMLANKFKSTGNSFAESSDGKCNIKCKLGSINEKSLNKLKAQGFKVETEEGSGLAKGRHIITSMTFPETDVSQKPITNRADYIEAVKNTANAVNLKKAFNSKSAFFTGSIFGAMLNTKFNLNKSSDLSSKAKDAAAEKGTTAKERVKAAIREKLGLPAIDIKAPKLTTEEKAKADPKIKAATDFVSKSKPAALALNGVDVMSGICMTYNVTKGVTYASKAAKITATAGITMLILSEVSKVKAGEETDPEVVSVLGDMFTKIDASGNTATSSPGYRSAVYGENVTLSDEDKKYSVTNSNSDLLKTIGALTTLVGMGGGIAIGTMSKLCGAAASPIVDFATACPAELSVAAATAIETGGVGAGGALVVCLGKTIIKNAAIGAAIGIAIDNMIPLLISGELPQIDENTYGSALGNSMTTGLSAILGGKAASFGLKAGNKAQIEQYAIDTASAEQEQADIAKYEAKDAPLDISNQYSFLGSIAKNMNIGSLYNTSVASQLGNLISFLPKSLASLTNSAGAEANSKAETYSKCEDQSLKNIGVDGDTFCNPYYVMSSEEMNADMLTTAQYMIDGGYIAEDTGEVIKNGNNYQKYLDNCANRVEPLGETAAGVEDADYLWKTGYNCTLADGSDLAKNLSYFRTYTMDVAINSTMDGDEVKGASTEVAAGTTIDVANLFQPSDNIPCAAGTTEAMASADGYTEGNLVKIKLCYIPNTSETDDEDRTFDLLITVNSRVSGAWLALINEMRTATGDDIISASSSFRTPEMQANNPNGAQVNYSNHQMGLAVDFGSLYCEGCSMPAQGEKKYFDSLQYNGSGKKYGFNFLDDGVRIEHWHWEPLSISYE